VARCQEAVARFPQAAAQGACVHQLLVLLGILLSMASL
jgi:hypothetical protein